MAVIVGGLGINFYLMFAFEEIVAHENFNNKIIVLR